LHKFKKIAADVEKFFQTNQVDAVILVDYPGFNWHIAKRAKKYGIPVFYFMPPQIWSWAQWRIKKMRALIDHVLCCLPFEKRWFESKGCNVHWVGHPFFEEVKKRTLDQKFLDSLAPIREKGPILTLLPGSRNQEVHANFTDFQKVVQKVKQAVPNVQPVVAAFNETHADWIRQRAAICDRENFPNIPVFVKKTPELIHAAKCCLAVSGSVSMELLANVKPSVIYYRIGYLPYFVQRHFRRSRFITLVNLLAADRSSGGSLDGIFYPDSMRLAPVHPLPEDRQKMLFPEFLTWKPTPEAAGPLIEWLTNEEILRSREQELQVLLDEEYQGGSPIANTVAILRSTLR